MGSFAEPDQDCGIIKSARDASGPAQSPWVESVGRDTVASFVLASCSRSGTASSRNRQSGVSEVADLEEWVDPEDLDRLGRDPSHLQGTRTEEALTG